MAHAMHPEQSRHERFLQYAQALKERFAEGVLSELQDLPQWVVWRAELEDGRPKKVPYNPQYAHLQPRASVKIPIPNAPQAVQDCIFSRMDSYQEKGYTPPLRCMDKTALPPSPPIMYQEHQQPLNSDKKP